MQPAGVIYVEPLNFFCFKARGCQAQLALGELLSVPCMRNEPRACSVAPINWINRCPETAWRSTSALCCVY